MSRLSPVVSGGAYGRRRIVRAVLVVEFTQDQGAPSGALLVEQQGGEMQMMFEEKHTWDGFGHQIPLGRPRRHDLTLSGYGGVHWWENADDLFAQWRGSPSPQPPTPPGIGPAQPTLKEGE